MLWTTPIIWQRVQYFSWFRFINIISDFIRSCYCRISMKLTTMMDLRMLSWGRFSWFVKVIASFNSTTRNATPWADMLASHWLQVTPNTWYDSWLNTIIVNKCPKKLQISLQKRWSGFWNLHTNILNNFSQTIIRDYFVELFV